LEAAHVHWRAKSNLLEAWRIHLERYASPTVLGRYQRGLSPDEQASMLAKLEDVSRHSAIVFPQEIEIGTLGGDRGPSLGFQEAIEFHNREIARSILGQTLTTDEGRRVGSLALGKVHLQVLLLQISALRRELADTVMTEQIIRPLIELNFGPGPIPRFEFEETRLEAFATGRLDGDRAA
jgi:phage gp29-like protein